jgi:hypothetical protein
MEDRTFIDQVTDMQREIRKLRSTNAAQADHIGLLKKQYDDLAEDHSAALSEFRAKIHDAYTARDTAERELSEIKVTLRTVASTIADAFHAMAGDAVKEEPQQPQAEVKSLNRQQPEAHRLLRNTMGN